MGNWTSSSVTGPTLPDRPLSAYPLEQALIHEQGWYRVHSDYPTLYNVHNVDRFGPFEYPVNGASFPMCHRWDRGGGPETHRTGWGLGWKRWRAKLPATLLHDYRETYLRLTLKWDPENAVEIIPDDLYLYPDPEIEEVDTVTFTIPAGQTESPWEYATPISIGNDLISEEYLPIEFREHEPESGFDNFPRHPENPKKPERAWLMVPGDGDRPAKTDLHGAGSRRLTLEVNEGSQSLTPQETGASDPLEVAITASEPVDESNIEVETVRMLDLSAYRKRTLNVAVWAVTMTNDDHETNIQVGKGQPSTLCVQATGNILFSTAQGDDIPNWAAKTITTGPDGICQTQADSHDTQMIAPGQGQPYATVIEPGPNGFLNTMNEGDDTISGQMLTAGADGIRQTATPRPRVEPQNVPTEEALQSYLNKVYGDQMNVVFDVTLTAIEAAYDRVPGENDEIAVLPPPTGPVYPLGMGINNGFDFFYTGEPSGEELAILQAAFDPTKQINVYLFGTRINEFDPTTGTLDPTPLHGKVRRLGDFQDGCKLCYVSATGIDENKIMWTVAHEIGHTGGLWHPRHVLPENTLSPPASHWLHSTLIEDGR